jgi:hypothetical protein
MVYDLKRHEMVLFNGATWTWDGLKWTPRNPTHSPGGSGAMTYDGVRGVVVLFRAGDSGSETWTWDGKDWTQKKPATKPPARNNSAMVFDSARGVAVLFGGGEIGGGQMNDTWTWNGSNWTKKSPMAKPLPRFNHAMAYDPIRKQVVLFGGFALTPDVGYGPVWDTDTWTWNGANWTKRAVAAAPSIRSGQLMAWDGGSGGVLLFGGEFADRYDYYLFDDTWIWNGKIWRAQPRKGSPPPSGIGAWDYPEYLVGAWDPDRKQVMMLTFNFENEQAESWIWKGNPPDAVPTATSELDQ